jgi:hypothetical protein
VQLRTSGSQKWPTWHWFTRSFHPAGQNGHDSGTLLLAAQKCRLGHTRGAVLFSGQ